MFCKFWVNTLITYEFRLLDDRKLKYFQNPLKDVEIWTLASGILTLNVWWQTTYLVIICIWSNFFYFSILIVWVQNFEIVLMQFSHLSFRSDMKVISYNRYDPQSNVFWRVLFCFWNYKYANSRTQIFCFYVLGFFFLLAKWSVPPLVNLWFRSFLFGSKIYFDCFNFDNVNLDF